MRMFYSTIQLVSNNNTSYCLATANNMGRNPMTYRALVLIATATGTAFAAYAQPPAGVPPSAHQRSADETKGDRDEG